VHEVYDLSVGGTHSFVANDLIVHNSTVCVLIPLYVWRETKKRVLIISPEMDKRALAERFFGFFARASLTGMMRGTLGAFEEQRLRQAVADLLHQEGLWIMDASDDITPRGIDAMIRTVKPDLVAVDSLYSIRTSGSRFDRTEAALDWLNTSNKKYGYAAVAFSQQNRTKELSGKLGGGARLGTIAFSDQMGMDAHAVFSLEQGEDDKLDRRMQFLPLKIRRGYSEGPVVCHWDFACCNFEEIVKDRSDAYEDSSFKPGPVPTADTAGDQEPLPF
jgi:replicative DNA helicase